jgi:hypothetical protein
MVVGFICQSLAKTGLFLLKRLVRANVAGTLPVVKMVTQKEKFYCTIPSSSNEREGGIPRIAGLHLTLHFYSVTCMENGDEPIF